MEQTVRITGYLPDRIGIPSRNRYIPRLRKGVSMTKEQVVAFTKRVAARLAGGEVSETSLTEEHLRQYRSIIKREEADAEEAQRQRLKSA